jgi:hypothetical protein
MLRETVPVVEDFLPPARAFLVRVRQGVEDGSITKANLNQRADALVEEMLKPVFDQSLPRLMQILKRHGLDLENMMGDMMPGDGDDEDADLMPPN